MTYTTDTKLEPYAEALYLNIMRKYKDIPSSGRRT